MSAIVGLCVEYKIDITDSIGSIANYDVLFSAKNMKKTFLEIKDLQYAL
ncbi:hypothetical protein JHD46_08595 [Sulfurimonas sp. SAG-AH-194-C20]|nr:hypothetical protein [Sulfurimonas sp. SAG-AH-194-C20]